MKKIHIHIKVKDLEKSLKFYNALFQHKASVVKPDYAKWMLEDPKVNFAISSGEGEGGIKHLGIQVDSQKELDAVYDNMEKTQGDIYNEGETVCCYAHSNKSWLTDPQGVSWEAFYTSKQATVYGKKSAAESKNHSSACCNETTVSDVSTSSKSCC